MGRLQKRLVIAIANATAGFKADKRKMMLSIVSLLLSAAVLISSTVCWYALASASGNTNTITLKTDNGLRVNDLGESLNEIAKNAYLIPASSVDGRNIFFPADGESFSDQTSDMVFRTANTGDKNYSYLQYDFELSAEENYTGIYLDLDHTYVYFEGWDSSDSDVSSQALIDSRAIRAAIYYEGMDNNQPIVFTSQKSIKTTEAVDMIDTNDGSFLATATQTAVPFKDYSYGKRQLANMDKGEKRRFSLIVWLEGTVAECDNSLIGKQLDLNIRLTTSWDNTEKIVFEDQTNNQAVASALSNNSYILALYYDNEAHNINDYRFTLYEDESSTPSKHVWYCNIPGNAVSKLTFRVINLVPAEGSDGIVLEWTKTLSNKSTTNRVDSTKFIADNVNAKDSRGHWYDGAIEDSGTGHDIGDGDLDDNDW